MTPYTKQQIAAMEREKMLRDAWNQADHTPSVQSPWVKQSRESGDARDHRVAVWGWVAVAAASAIMFMLGWLVRGAIV